jgi:PST family polysaccharide transporter
MLYSKEFEAMTQLFAFQLIGDFFKMAAWILAYLMLAKAMTKAFIITEVVFSISYVLLGYVCIHLFNLNGITIAFAINYFIYLIIMIALFRKLLFK